jgi:hypothetical protein
MAPGKGPCYVEFWLPASQPLDIRHLAVPKVDLPPEDKIPLFSWPPRAGVDRWLRVFRAWAFQRLGTLPPAPGLGENEWAPRGIESLGPALAWAAERTGEPDRSRWLLQLGAWQAARGQCALAIQMLARSSDDRAPALAGRLLWRGQGDPQRGAEAYRRLRNPLISNHPQVVVERDACLGALGPSTLEEREAGLAPLAASTDEWVIERRATWLADAGRWAEAKALLECTPFQLVHQRYERTRLWRRVKTALGIVSEDPPGWLGEDDLASFGAYRQFEADRSKPPGESG